MRLRTSTHEDPGTRVNVGPGVRSWRATTAIRAFVLALTAGMVVSESAARESGPLLAALVLIAGVSSALEWGTLARTTPWVPVGESALVAILLTSAAYQPGLLPYLAVPAVVAGVRHGWVTTVNASFVGAVAVTALLVRARAVKHKGASG